MLDYIQSLNCEIHMENKLIVGVMLILLLIALAMVSAIGPAALLFVIVWGVIAGLTFANL